MRRGTFGWAFWPCLALVFAMATLPCQQEPAAQAETLRLEIVGASVSAGFVDGVLTGGNANNQTVPLGMLVKRWLGEGDAKVQSRADAMMFLDAERSGSVQLERAKKQNPTVLLAVDFLFWFAYGQLGSTGKAATEARTARLKEGLALLDTVPCPILISDLPDMRGASPRMLRPSMIPSPEDLELLNAEIRSWASTRPRVRVFDLAKTVAQLKNDGVKLPCGDHEVASGPGALLQTDLLHANRLGMAYLGLCLEPHVRELVPEALRSKLPAAGFLEFCEFAGATADLEELAEKDEAGKKAPAKEVADPAKK